MSSKDHNAADKGESRSSKRDANNKQPSSDDHFPKLHSFSSKEIAEEMTLLDAKLLRMIKASELENGVWMKKELKNKMSPNIVAMVQSFNRAALLVPTEILDEETPQARAKVIVAYIKVAQECYVCGNYNSLKAILAGLQSTPIFRLSKTWREVPSKKKRKYDNLSELMHEDNNWAAYRSEVDQNLQGNTPFIPFLGVFLTTTAFSQTASQRTSNKVTAASSVPDMAKRSTPDNRSIVPEKSNLYETYHLLEAITVRERLEKLRQNTITLSAENQDSGSGKNKDQTESKMTRSRSPLYRFNSTPLYIFGDQERSASTTSSQDSGLFQEVMSELNFDEEEVSLFPINEYHETVESGKECVTESENAREINSPLLKSEDHYTGSQSFNDDDATIVKPVAEISQEETVVVDASHSLTSFKDGGTTSMDNGGVDTSEEKWAYRVEAGTGYINDTKSDVTNGGGRGYRTPTQRGEKVTATTELQLDETDSDSTASGDDTFKKRERLQSMPSKSATKVRKKARTSSTPSSQFEASIEAIFKSPDQGDSVSAGVMVKMRLTDRVFKKRKLFAKFFRKMGQHGDQNSSGNSTNQHADNISSSSNCTILSNGPAFEYDESHKSPVHDLEINDKNERLSGTIRRRNNEKMTRMLSGSLEGLLGAVDAKLPSERRESTKLSVPRSPSLLAMTSIDYHSDAEDFENERPLSVNGTQLTFLDEGVSSSLGVGPPRGEDLWTSDQDIAASTISPKSLRKSCGDLSSKESERDMILPYGNECSALKGEDRRIDLHNVFPECQVSDSSSIDSHNSSHSTHGTRSHFPVPMFLRRHRRNSSHPNIPFHKENEKTEKQKISPSPKNQQLVLGTPSSPLLNRISSAIHSPSFIHRRRHHHKPITHHNSVTKVEYSKNPSDLLHQFQFLSLGCCARIDNRPHIRRVLTDKPHNTEAVNYKLSYQREPL